MAIRYAAVQFIFRNEKYDWKEKIFIAGNSAKGIAVAVITFSLATQEIPDVKLLLDLILTFMIYSILLSTILVKFSKYFTKVEPL